MEGVSSPNIWFLVGCALFHLIERLVKYILKYSRHIKNSKCVMKASMDNDRTEEQTPTEEEKSV